jgi:spore coat protein U-like protein
MCSYQVPITNEFPPIPIIIVRGDKLMNNRFTKAMLLTAIVGFTGTASAATTTTSLAVSANVIGTCTVSTAGLAFGTYDPAQPTDLTQTATISTTCTTGIAYDIGLDAGTGAGATVANRLMTSGGNTLAYGLYSDSGHTTNWGNTVGTDTVAATGTGAAQTATVYGKITAGTPAVLGSYADSVLVTVTY